MRYFLFYILSLSLFFWVFPSHADDLPDKKTRQLCSKSQECTYATTPCGSKEAVNILYQADLQKKYDAYRDEIDCIWYDNRVVTAQYCLAAQCHIIVQHKKEETDKKTK